MKDKKKSWFRRHWIVTGILGLIALSLIMSIFDGIGNEIKYADYSDNGLVIVNSSLLIPQDSEINRIWRVNDMVSIATDAIGFIEGTERQMSKTEDFGGSSVIVKAYRFDSNINANQFYSKEKQGIDIRGVNEWDLGEDCFGIQRDTILSDYAEGFCLRSNVVLYVRSSSTSYSNEGKSFMNMMTKKV